MHKKTRDVSIDILTEVLVRLILRSSFGSKDSPDVPKVKKSQKRAINNSIQTRRKFHSILFNITIASRRKMEH